VSLPRCRHRTYTPDVDYRIFVGWLDDTVHLWWRILHEETSPRCRLLRTWQGHPLDVLTKADRHGIPRRNYSRVLLIPKLPSSPQVRRFLRRGVFIVDARLAHPGNGKKSGARRKQIVFLVYFITSIKTGIYLNKQDSTRLQQKFP